MPPWSSKASVAMYRRGVVLVYSQKRTSPSAARNFTVLSPPSGPTVLADIDFTKHWLVMSLMDDGSPRVELLAPPADLESEWTRRDFALPAASQSYVDSIDSERDDTVLVHVE